MCDVIVISISRMLRACSLCYHNSKHSLVIVGTLVLRLKAAESFLETSQYIWEHNNVEVQKNPDHKM